MCGISGCFIDKKSNRSDEYFKLYEDIIRTNFHRGPIVVECGMIQKKIFLLTTD